LKWAFLYALTTIDMRSSIWVEFAGFDAILDKKRDDMMIWWLQDLRSWECLGRLWITRATHQEPVGPMGYPKAHQLSHISMPLISAGFPAKFDNIIRNYKLSL
jgi:hypothetical protein